MSNPSDSSNHSPDDALPEVQPPRASFVVQLFLLPFFIVVVIVMVWLLFNWLAQVGSDPRSSIEALGRDNAERWHAAANLADALQNPRNGELRRDHEAAAKLAAILRTELKTPLVGGERAVEQDVNLRVYLCRALGEFEVTDGLPVLVEAASEPAAGGEASGELQVRRSAIEAIAILADNIRRSSASTDAADLEAFRAMATPVLLEAASEQDLGSEGDAAAPLRATAAFALGVVGGEQALVRLEQLLVDANPNVRYNAATGLARNGDPRATPVLIEMLDPDDTRGVDVENNVDERPYKRLAIYRSAFQAVLLLADLAPVEQLGELETAIDDLLADERTETRVRVDAIQVQSRLRELAQASDSDGASSSAP